MEVSPLPQTADRVSSTSTVGLLSQAPSPSVLGAAFFSALLSVQKPSLFAGILSLIPLKRICVTLRFKALVAR